jgi:enamine deaminase RidA (YjgF/YER057c/UK114 family)
MTIAARLKEHGLALPTAPKPIAAYVPAVTTGTLVFVSGQLPMVDGLPMATGPVPTRTSIDQAQKAAARCVLNGLAIMADHLDGDLERIVRVVRIGVFVLSDDGFSDQPIVANGASELLGQLLGDAGQHARAAVGVNALPLNASVEIEFCFEIA